MPTSSRCRGTQLADAALSAARRRRRQLRRPADPPHHHRDRAAARRRAGDVGRHAARSGWRCGSSSTAPGVSPRTPSWTRRWPPRPRAARSAVATTLAPLNAERIELAPEPVYSDVTLGVGLPHRPVRRAGRRQDRRARRVLGRGCSPPTASTTSRPACRPSRSRRSTPTRSARRSPSSGCACSPRSRPSRSTPRRARSRRCAPWRRRRRAGWEAVAGDDVWDWSTELAELPSLLAEKTKAPDAWSAGPTDLVIDPSNLWLTIHESIGHATEYDRAIGYEAAYAGTSFATPDKLGVMRYGSPVMNVTADRTVEFGLATIGFDDEGVRAQKLGPGARRRLRRLSARPGVRAAARARPGPTAARTPIRRTTCRSSGWPTCRCSRAPRTSAPRT